MFSKDLYCRHVKTRACLAKGWKRHVLGLHQFIYMIDCTVFYTVFNIISIIFWWPVHLFRHFWNFSNSTPHKVFWLLSHQTIMNLRLKHRGHWFNPQISLFLSDWWYSQCDRINSSLADDRCFNGDMWESSQWLNKNTLQSTGKKDTQKAWICWMGNAILLE